jgi:hypothetical protein
MKVCLDEGDLSPLFFHGFLLQTRLRVVVGGKLLGLESIPGLQLCPHPYPFKKGAGELDSKSLSQNWRGMQGEDCKRGMHPLSGGDL